MISLRKIGKSFLFNSLSRKFSQSTILEEVEAKVFQVLKSGAKCRIENMSLNSKFEELGYDSLDSVEMIVAMEEHFGFFIKDSEAEKIETVGDAVAIFNKYMVEIRSKEMLQTTENKEDEIN